MAETEFQDRCLKPLGHPSNALKTIGVPDIAAPLKKALFATLLPPQMLSISLYRSSNCGVNLRRRVLLNAGQEVLIYFEGNRALECRGAPMRSRDVTREKLRASPSRESGCEGYRAPWRDADAFMGQAVWPKRTSVLLRYDMGLVGEMDADPRRPARRGPRAIGQPRGWEGDVARPAALRLLALPGLFGAFDDRQLPGGSPGAGGDLVEPLAA